MKQSSSRDTRAAVSTLQGKVTQLLNRLPFILLICSLGAIALIIPVAAVTGMDFGSFTRDPTHLGELRWFAGYLSSLGVMAWTSGAIIALFASGVLFRSGATSNDHQFLAYFGILTAVLAFDDLYLIHENFFLGEKALFLVYGVYALIGCALFRQKFRTQAKNFAIAAALFFVMSLMVDRVQHLVQDTIGDSRILIEDGAKFMGAVCWAIFLAKFSADSIISKLLK